jgi:hypothetical protein
MDEFVGPADPDDARDDYDDVMDDCASVATDSTTGYEKDDDGEFGAPKALAPRSSCVLCAAAHARHENGATFLHPRPQPNVTPIRHTNNT